MTTAWPQPTRAHPIQNRKRSEACMTRTARGASLAQGDVGPRSGRVERGGARRRSTGCSFVLEGAEAGGFDFHGVEPRRSEGKMKLSVLSVVVDR